MSQSVLVPQDPRTWLRIADHPIYRGLASSAAEWSLDPSMYAGIRAASWMPEWYSPWVDPVAADAGEASAMRDLTTLRLIAESLIQSDPSWKVEVFILDDFTMYLMCRRPGRPDALVYPSEAGPRLFAGIDPPEEREYRELPAPTVVQILGRVASGGSLDEFRELEA